MSRVVARFGTAVGILLATSAGAQQVATDHTADMPGMSHSEMAQMSSMDDMSEMDVQGMLGRYPMTRESSGTAWQPDSAPMKSAMLKAGRWSLMAEGQVTAIYDHQGGPRGATQSFTSSMGMLMANRDLSERDRVGLRAMLSLDPAMGRSGYPLLFASGESADGKVPLVDRQHPHDLFMELAGTWSHDLGDGRAVSLYGGLPGEPALGPPNFMHRASGMDNPEAPIGHHWLDSTHITYGVVTAGLSNEHWKVESSAFNGREPDQHRWNIEEPRLDSWAARVFWNPTANLSFQISTGHLHSPEQLEPDRDEQRTTASVSWNRRFGLNDWATTLAWSNKNENPGPSLAGLLAETALRRGRQEVYVRAEREEENELLDSAAGGRIFKVSKLSLGYQQELTFGRHLFLAIGGLASAYAYPGALRPRYGSEGAKSFMLYARLRLGV